MKYLTFSDLPNHIRIKIQKLGVGSPDEWVMQKMPALGNRSVLEVMSSVAGEEEVVKILNRIEGKFF